MIKNNIKENQSIRVTFQILKELCLADLDSSKSIYYFFLYKNKLETLCCKIIDNNGYNDFTIETNIMKTLCNLPNDNIYFRFIKEYYQIIDRNDNNGIYTLLFVSCLMLNYELNIDNMDINCINEVIQFILENLSNIQDDKSSIKSINGVNIADIFGLIKLNIMNISELYLTIYSLINSRSLRYYYSDKQIKMLVQMISELFWKVLDIENLADWQYYLHENLKFIQNQDGENFNVIEIIEGYMFEDMNDLDYQIKKMRNTQARKNNNLVDVYFILIESVRYFIRSLFVQIERMRPILNENALKLP